MSSRHWMLAGSLVAFVAAGGCGPSQDDVGTLAEKATTVAQLTYGFDLEGQLAHVSTPSGDYTIARTGDTLRVGASSYRFDALGRVAAIDDRTIAYGPDGQIDHVIGGGGTVSYVYDENGQRIAKSVNGSPSTAYVEEGTVTASGLVEEVHVGGALVGLLSSGRFELLATDNRGTVQADSTGAARTATPFGDRPVHPDEAAAVDYAGKAYDAELAAVRMGARDYDPRSGRFLEPDPLFLLEPEHCVKSPTECSLYGYARGNPTTFVDPKGTWSSVATPFSDAVHQEAIAKVLSRDLGRPFIRFLESVQSEVDDKQAAADQPLHAMVGHGLNRENAIEQANKNVAEQLAGAKDFLRNPKALHNLGVAIHALQDATSPAHKGFQEYDDTSKSAEAKHASLELHYPKAGTVERQELEGATRWAYDIASGKAPMPEKFFDSKSGALLLPDSYRK